MRPSCASGTRRVAPPTAVDPRAHGFVFTRCISRRHAELFVCTCASTAVQARQLYQMTHCATVTVQLDQGATSQAYRRGTIVVVSRMPQFIILWCDKSLPSSRCSPREHEAACGRTYPVPSRDQCQQSGLNGREKVLSYLRKPPNSPVRGIPPRLCLSATVALLCSFDLVL